MARAAGVDVDVEATTATLPQWVDGFLSQRQCDEILDELEITLWKPSRVVYRFADGVLRDGLSRRRRSETAYEEWFSPELRRVLRRIERRLVRRFGLGAVRREPWQATRYGHGDGFDEHHDAGHGISAALGDRERTFVLYLSAPARGGGTRFPELGLEVEARAGRLLTWKNLLPNGEPDPRMIHSGAPVLRGSKTVLVTWTRQDD